MGLYRAFSKIVKFLFPFGDFLWTLQKEEYSVSRYMFWLTRFFWRRNFVVSEKLVLTKRAKMILVLSIGIWLFIAGVFLGAAPEVFMGVALLAALVFVPVSVGLAALFLEPLFVFVHMRLQKRAQALVHKRKTLKIIAIAGSYGKTTTKHFIYDLVRYHFRTQMIPGNINTPAGIAQWLVSSLAPTTELLIAEMDAYMKGEIAQSARMLPPSIAVVTNVGDQHLVRFGSKDALARSLSELVEATKENGSVVVDSATREALLPFVSKGAEKLVVAEAHVYKGETVVADHLSVSNKENLMRALKVAELLDIPAPFVIDSAKVLELPDKRQQRTTLFGYEAIDDSYNISYTTACAGIDAARTLATSVGKKLLVVAAGIPELGPEERTRNTELGACLDAKADATIVLNTIFKDEIVAGFVTNEKYEVFNRLSDFLEVAHQCYPPEEWVFLLQPALPDLYY